MYGPERLYIRSLGAASPLMALPLFSWPCLSAHGTASRIGDRHRLMAPFLDINERRGRLHAELYQPRLFGNSIRGHTTKAPPSKRTGGRIGFELAMDKIRFYVFADSARAGTSILTDG